MPISRTVGSTQLEWVVVNSFLPTCKRKGWYCHGTSLFSFSHQPFRYPAGFRSSLTRSLPPITWRSPPNAILRAKKQILAKSLSTLCGRKIWVIRRFSVCHNLPVFPCSLFPGYGSRDNLGRRDVAGKKIGMPKQGSQGTWPAGFRTTTFCRILLASSWTARKLTH